jgi:hypothetical protein
MDSKKFWQSALNWGFLTGAGLFIMNLIGWAFKLETTNSWLYELLLFVVICPAIIYTGKQNAAHSGPAGYSYGQAIGFVFAMMMFAGVVYGVGRFLIINFMGVEYYSTLNELAAEQVVSIYRGMIGQEMVLRMLRNPFYLIFESVIGMVSRGGFLGLVLCAFVYTKPDLFATAAAEISQNDENE